MYSVKNGLNRKEEFDCYQTNMYLVLFLADINECEADGDSCPANSDCTNLVPGFTCACSGGFVDYGGNCYERCAEGFQWDAQFQCTGKQSRHRKVEGKIFMDGFHTLHKIIKLFCRMNDKSEELPLNGIKYLTSIMTNIPFVFVDLI